MVVIRVGSDTFELAENPIWWEINNSYLWVDIEKGNLYKYDLNKNIVERILSTHYRIGAFVLNQENNIILLTEKGLIKVIEQNNEYYLDEDYLYYYPLKNERFNDAICDKNGRIIAGIKRDDNSTLGRVVVFDKFKDVKTLITNVKISNGMGFSKDNNTFYHTDSLNREIYKYDYDLESGQITNKQVLYRHEGCGVPDGMSVDANDNILTCIWDEGKLLKIDTIQGNISEQYLLPCKCCSSIIFGGSALDQILLTSAKISIDEKYLSQDDGGIFLIEGISSGKNEYKAK